MPHSLSHGFSVNCPLSSIRAKSELSKSVCILLLKTDMYASQDEISLDSSVATTLLDRHKELSETAILRCDSYLSRSMQLAAGNAPLFTPSALPTLELSSRGWRESLLKNLSTAAQQQHHSIVNIVSEICQDFETRCDNTEQPLREAKERSTELELKLYNSEATLTRFENQARERLSDLQALEDENHRLVKQVDTVEQSLQELSTSHEQLSYRLECMKEDALKFTENTREQEEQANLTHLAIITGKDELNEKQALKLAEAEAHAMRLEDELARQSATSEGILSRLENAMNAATEQLDATKSLAAAREREITRLLEHEAYLASEKQNLELKVLQEPNEILTLIR